jgi:hypothetical protein
MAIPPFAAGCTAVRLHCRTVDQDLRWRPSCRCQNIKDVDPYALRGPPDKPVVERFVRAIDIRRIDPATARLQDVHDAADNPPIIDPRLASRISRQQWREPGKLIFR